MKRATTSASNIFRRKLCPGSERMEEGLPETENEFSDEGKVLHRLFLTGDRPETLTRDQKTVLDQADWYANEFFGKLRAQFQIPESANYIEEREVPLVFRDEKGNELFPGHADCVRTWLDYSVRGIVDAKFGFMEVEAAPDNLQLACYAIMRAQKSPAGVTGVCIVQPRNFGPRYTDAIYDIAHVPAAAQEIQRILAKTKDPNAPLIPGDEQCHFCKAKTLCPAYAEKFMAVEIAKTRAISTLTGDELERVHIAVSFAAKISHDVREEMRERIRNGQMPGWALQNSGDVTKLNDSVGLYKTLKAYFEQAGKEFTASEFDKCLDVVWEKLRWIIQDKTGMSDKRTKEFLDEMARPFTTKTPKEKRVVRAKQKALQ